MTGPLSDQAWAEFCAIAATAGLRPNADARAKLSAYLFNDYPVFAYNRERWAERRKRAERMLKRLTAFEADYRAEFAPADDAVRTDDVKIRIRPDLRAIEGLQRHVQSLLLIANTLKDANSRNASEQRAMLYHWLCEVWLDHFHAPDLRYSRPSKGGDPYGPLIDFMLAAMRQIMPKGALPDPETVADAIDRERRGRERARQLWLDLRTAHGGLTLKK